MSLNIGPTNPNVALGTNLQLAVYGTFSDQADRDLTDKVSWSSSDTGVATIGNMPGNEGLVSSVSQGVTSIVASVSGVTSASGVTGNTSLTVTTAALVSIDVTPTTSIAVGENATVYGHRAIHRLIQSGFNQAGYLVNL